MSDSSQSQVSSLKSSPLLDHFGRAVHPRQLQPADVQIEEVAEALSKICRFRGAYHGPLYSVAEHSLNVLALLETETNNPLVQLVGLLHDAHEAFLGDIPDPWYPFFIVCLDDNWGRIPLAKHADVLQDRVLRLLLPARAVQTYEELRAEIFQIVNDADRQILLWEKDQICHSTLPWPDQEMAHSIPRNALQKLVNHYSPGTAIRHFIISSYGRLFAATEAALA